MARLTRLNFGLRLRHPKHPRHSRPRWCNRGRLRRPATRPGSRADAGRSTRSSLHDLRRLVALRPMHARQFAMRINGHVRSADGAMSSIPYSAIATLIESLSTSLTDSRAYVTATDTGPKASNHPLCRCAYSATHHRLQRRRHQVRLADALAPSRPLGSDGKYTPKETFTDTYTDGVGIRQDYEYQDDDGQRGASSSEIKDARGILNWFKESLLTQSARAQAPSTPKQRAALSAASVDQRAASRRDGPSASSRPSCFRGRRAGSECAAASPESRRPRAVGVLG